MLKTPFDAKPDDLEEVHQQALFMWANKVERHGFLAANDELAYSQYDYTMEQYGKNFAFPEIRFMFAIPNGGLRNKITATKLKVQGVKRGVPDIMLPLNRKGHCGLFIEMKRAGKHNKPTIEQQDYIDFLNKEGYIAITCYSWQQAVEQIENYIFDN